MKKEEIDNKLNLSVWKDFFKILKPYKKQFISIVFIMIITAAFDIIFPLMAKYSIDNFVVTKEKDGLILFSSIYLLAAVLFAITIYFFISKAGKLETKMAYDIRKISFKKLQTLSLSYYDSKSTGWIMSRMTSDIRKLSEIITWGLVDLSWGLFLVLGISIVMLILNFKLGLIVLTVIPFVGLASIYFQKKILIAQRLVRSQNSEILAAFSEGIQGAKTTKTLAREDMNFEEFKSISKAMRLTSIKSVILSSLYLPIVLILGSIGLALSVNYGGNFLIKNIISYGTLVVFLTYSAQLFEPIRQMAHIFTEIQSAQASAERIFSLINEESDIKDSLETIKRYGDVFTLNKENLPQVKGHIEFQNVSFSYKNSETIIENFNLKVEAGETIALVGETGAGKTTIVNLFSRFYEPSSGTIFIDNIDYKDMPQKWIHDNLGYVLQTPHLFNDTVMNNIRYGNLQASDEDIIHVCRLLNIHEFIVKLKDSYKTVLGEGGDLLSTGQKQLISFARAIIRNPRLFVLDEATSSIDTETEKAIQEAIKTIIKGRTSFIIAHRLSTIKNADRILLIENGKIIESGSHKDLINQRASYYKLYKNQFLEEESKKILSH